MSAGVSGGVGGKRGWVKNGSEWCDHPDLTAFVAPMSIYLPIDRFNGAISGSYPQHQSSKHAPVMFKK